MKNSILILPMALLASATLAGCSLFPDTTSRPVVTSPIRPVPSAPAPNQSTSSPATTSTDQGLNTPEKIAEFEAACKAAHGNWNACASPCRNQPDAQVCIQSCMMVCECGGVAGFRCPAGYECTDYVPGPNVPDAMGICRPTQVSTRDKEFVGDEFAHTTVVVVGEFADGRVRVGNPVIFHGTTTVFENQFSWRVKDASGAVVASGRAYANSPDTGQPGPFSVKAFLDVLPAGNQGTLDVYDNSPKDGAEQVFVSAPLSFSDLKTAKTDVYFTNPKLVKDQNDCSEVFPVTRTLVASVDSNEAAMHALLKGPTQREKAAGYATALPEAVNQPSFNKTPTGLVVDFDDTLSQGVGGSCRVTAMRAQIEKTLGESCANSGCKITVNGSEEQALQP